MDIPGYRIVDTLGEGGMGTVYLAIQQSFEREVALKVMSPSLSQDPAFGERFLREARINSRLVHPNIVTVYDVGVHDGHHYLSMEYVPGQDLKNCRDRLDLHDILKVVKDVARALNYAGRKGYVHRDVKPDNIMLHGEDSRAVLMDFGIARATDVASGMTQTGTTMGTPHYMSPEQAKGAQVDPRSDLYSLGVLFFQLLTGYVPFDGDSAVVVGIMHVSDPIPRLPAHLQVFQPIIDKVLTKDPKTRYQTGDELIRDIERLPGETIEAVKVDIAAAEPVVQADQSAPTEISNAVNTAEVTNAVSDNVEAASNPEESFRLSSEDGIGDGEPEPVGGGGGRRGLTLTLLGLLLATGGGGAAAYYYGWLPDLGGPFSDRPALAAASVSSAAVSVASQPGASAVSSSSSSSIPRASSSASVAGLAALGPDWGLPEFEPASSSVSSSSAGQGTARLERLDELRQSLKNGLDKAPALARVAGTLLDSDNPQAREAAEGALDQLDKAFDEAFNAATDADDLDRARELAAQAGELLPRAQRDERYQRQIEALAERQFINQQLARAENYLDEGALGRPAGANALEAYRAVLARDPDNARAREGLQRVAGRYAALAQERLNTGELSEAADFAERGLAIAPERAELQSLKQQVARERQARQARQEKIDSALELADTRLAAGELIAPRGESAFDAYQSVLALEGDNTDAREGLKTVENRLIERIEAMISAGSLDQASLALASARDRFAQSQSLLTLRARLDQKIEDQQPAISRLQVSNNPMQSLGEAVTPVTPGRVIHIGFEYQNLPAKSNLVQAVLYDGARSTQITQVPVIVTDKAGTWFFKIERPVEGFAEGAYRIELNLGDDNLAGTTFKVGK